MSVADLKPGAILVDDSFPHCFDADLALKRMKSDRDILTIGGGLIAFPGLEFVADHEFATWKSNVEILMPTAGLPGCAAGALLDRPMLGLVDKTAVTESWESFKRNGLSVPALHLERWQIDTAILAQIAKIRAFR